MIGFCTSFRARALARDWPYHVWLLERVVSSMLEQDGDESIVAIGCHDVPDTSLAQHPRVHFVPVATAVPARDSDEMVTDKVVKLSAAARVALAKGCDYIALNDADDLVSRRIGAHVASNRGANGWYTTSQHFYAYGGHVTRLQQIRQPSSGPCVIVRSDLLSFASPPFSGAWAERIARGGEHNYLKLLASHNVEVCTLAAVGLGHFKEFMAERGQPLAPLPFAGNVVINHKDSISTNGGPRGFQRLSRLGLLRRQVRWLPTLRPVTPALRKEFLIPSDREIPDGYSTEGSVFWR